MGHFEITGRHLVKHRSEEGEVISADESHLNVRRLAAVRSRYRAASTPANPPPKIDTCVLSDFPFVSSTMCCLKPGKIPVATQALIDRATVSSSCL